MKVLFLVALVIGSIQAFAGQSAVLSKTEIIEIKDPANAFACVEGDGGFIFTTVSLNTFSIPTEFGSNFRNSPGISGFLSNRINRAVPCQEAMKTIEEEIKNQGGKLRVRAVRSLSRFAYPDGTCQLHLAENVSIKVGSLLLSGTATFFVSELPNVPYTKCDDYIPDPI